jgi:four helix bundle protein
MTPQELQQRTFDFGVEAYRFARALLRNIETRHIGNQLTRAATSVAANNRAAGHARSRREFCSKIGTVREEADESLFWLDFIQAATLATGQVVKTLRMEAQELTAIFSASYRTAKRRLNAQRLARKRARTQRKAKKLQDDERSNDKRSTDKKAVK